MTEEFRREFRDYQARTWAGPVEQAAAEATTVYVQLEEWFNEPLNCEGVHRMSDCSHEVTHLLVWCLGRIRVCQVFAEIKAAAKAQPQRTCSDCGQAAVVCWRIPVI